MTLDPGAKAVLDLVAAVNAPKYHTVSANEARGLYRKARGALSPPAPDVAELRDLKIAGPGGDIALRFYRGVGADASNAPCLVFYHGGGWVIGDLDTHDVVCRMLANEARCAVLSVDYRMGPEHPFPAAVDDCWAATHWTAQNAATLGIDGARLAVGGDSAGGNLAAVIALMARDKGMASVQLQVLVYPATDQRKLTASHRDFAEGYLLESQTMKWFSNAYMPDTSMYLDWRASPALASSHVGLPPVLLVTAGYDPLRDEGREYAQKLIGAGVSVAYHEFPGQIHGFLTMGKMIPQTAELITLCAEALRRAFRN